MSGGQPLEKGFVELSVKGKEKAKRDLNDLSKKFKETGGFASNAAKVVAGAFSGAAVLGGIKMISDAYLDQERSINRMEAAYTAAGRTSAKQMGLLADQIEDLTLFSDDAARAAATILAPFEKLTDEVIKKTIPLAADVATVLGTDLPEAAQKLGKALSDPEKGLRGLKQMGIEFSSAEKEVLKVMMETNKVAEAQAIILQRVEDRFKGAAAAANQGLPRIVSEMGKSIDHIKEDIGAFYAGKISPDGSGKFGLQDMPFAFIGNQGGKDAYRKQIETDARTAENERIAASGDVAKARERRIAGEKAAAGLAAAQAESDRLWWGGTKTPEERAANDKRRLELQQQIEAAKKVDLPALRAAEQTAIASRDRLSVEAEAKKAKQEEFDVAVKQAEYYQAMKDRLASAKEQEAQMKAFEDARRSDFDARQKALAEQDAQMQAMDDARKQYTDDEIRRMYDAAARQQEIQGIHDQMREDADKPFNDQLEARMNGQSQRMGLGAYEQMITTATASHADLIPKEQLAELKRANKGLAAIDKNLANMGKFGAGAVA